MVSYAVPMAQGRLETSVNALYIRFGWMDWSFSVGLDVKRMDGLTGLRIEWSFLLDVLGLSSCLELLYWRLTLFPLDERFDFDSSCWLGEQSSSNSFFLNFVVKVLRPSGMSFFVYSLYVWHITNETHMYTVSVTPNRTPCAVAAATVLSTSSTRVRVLFFGLEE